MAKAVFTKADTGRWADGRCGHTHVRHILADLIGVICHKTDIIANDLRKPMSDDASEELDALDTLNHYTEEDLLWEMSDGDLLLSDCS